MSRFTEEGTFAVRIINAKMVTSKFSQEPGTFDVCLKVADTDGHEDVWRGEVSGAYGIGNNASKTQAQITLKRLEDLGWPHGVNFSRIGEMVGVETTATIKEKNGYYNIAWLGGGGNEPVALTEDEIAACLANVSQFFPEEEPAQVEAPKPAPKIAPKPAPKAAPARPIAPAMPAPKAGVVLQKGGNPFHKIEKAV